MDMTTSSSTEERSSCKIIMASIMQKVYQPLKAAILLLASIVRSFPIKVVSNSSLKIDIPSDVSGEEKKALKAKNKEIEAVISFTYGC